MISKIPNSDQAFWWKASGIFTFSATLTVFAIATLDVSGITSIIMAIAAFDDIDRMIHFAYSILHKINES